MSRKAVVANVIRAAIKEHPEFDATEIAKHVGCSDGYVHKVMRKDSKIEGWELPVTTDLVSQMMHSKSQADVRLKAIIAESDHINRLNKEITELKGIVRYLEGKLGGGRASAI